MAGASSTLRAGFAFETGLLSVSQSPAAEKQLIPQKADVEPLYPCQGCCSYKTSYMRNIPEARSTAAVAKGRSLTGKSGLTTA